MAGRKPKAAPAAKAVAALNLAGVTAAPWWPFAKWGAIIVAGILAIAVIANWWNDLWDFLPWSAENRAQRAKAAAVTSGDQAATASLETEGARQTTQRVEVVVTQRRAAEAATSALTADARISEDANQPLDAGRADRLRGHDGELCRIRPSLAGCAGPAGSERPAPRGDARDGADRLRPLQAPE